MSHTFEELCKYHTKVRMNDNIIKKYRTLLQKLIIDYPDYFSQHLPQYYDYAHYDNIYNKTISLTFEMMNLVPDEDHIKHILLPEQKHIIAFYNQVVSGCILDSLSKK